MDKSKKYVFTIRSLTGGGAERVVSVLANHMVEDGYNVSIICYGKTDHDYILSPKVNIYFMPTRSNNIRGKISRISDMRSIMQTIKPDVVIPFVGTVLFVSYIVSKTMNVPFVRTVRISPWMEEGGKLQSIIRNHLNYRALAIMVQNEEQIEFFPEKLRNKIFVVPNPISDEFLTKTKSEYRTSIKKFISVGRLTKQKNHELLIRAFSKIVETNEQLSLDIYGNGPEEDNLKALINELHLESKCCLKGRSDTIIDELVTSDVFVLTSDFEGMPNALMEAMAVGLPCISSDCRTGPKTLIDNEKDGLLFKTGDIDDLIAKMLWCLNHPESGMEMGKLARRKIISQYSYDMIYKSLIKMITALN